MKALILTPYPDLIVPRLSLMTEEVEVSMEEPSKWPTDADFIVSFGYNRIIKEPWLTMWKGKIVNVHVGYLPWNRGAHPNFWSWFDRTPKGVTIHVVDDGIDTGPILMRHQITNWSQFETLNSAYSRLMDVGAEMLVSRWKDLLEGKLYPFIDDSVGTYHSVSQTTPWLATLPKLWATQVSEVEALGDQARPIMGRDCNVLGASKH